MGNKIRAAEKGFSALEALFAVMILSFGLTGYLALLAQMARSTINDELTLIASNLASQKIEELISTKAQQGYSNIPNGNTQEQLSYSNRIFSRDTAIQWVSANDLVTPVADDQGYKRIDVTVSWDIGVSQQVQVTSLVSSY